MYSAKFVITNEDADDCEDDVIRVRGLDWARFAENPVVLLGHDPRVPIGTSRDPETGHLDIEVRGRRVIGTAHLHEVTRESKEAAELVRQGILSAASIGVTAVRSKRRGRGLDILAGMVNEWSLVGVGCNAGCLRVKLNALNCSPILTKALCGGATACRCHGCRLDPKRLQRIEAGVGELAVKVARLAGLVELARR